GVHDNDNVLAVAVPVQLWGPASVIRPLALKVPGKTSKRGAKDSEQFVCMNVAFWPMRDASQCAANGQVPARWGDPAPTSAESFPVESPEPELQAHKAHEKRNDRAEVLVMTRLYGAL